MPTPIDQAMNSRNFFFGFAGLVTVAAAWSIWGQDMFPQHAYPNSEPNTWTEKEMRQWLKERKLETSKEETREQLLTRIEAIKRAIRSG